MQRHQPMGGTLSWEICTKKRNEHMQSWRGFPKREDTSCMTHQLYKNVAGGRGAAAPSAAADRSCEFLTFDAGLPLLEKKPENHYRKLLFSKTQKQNNRSTRLGDKLGPARRVLDLQQSSTHCSRGQRTGNFATCCPHVVLVEPQLGEPCGATRRSPRA